jgi:hypothetical protein
MLFSPVSRFIYRSLKNQIQALRGNDELFAEIFITRRQAPITGYQGIKSSQEVVKMRGIIGGGLSIV